MLTADAMTFYDLIRPLDGAGWFETEHYKQVEAELRAAIAPGGLVALIGVPGTGKNVVMERLMATLEEEGRSVVSQSVSLDKSRVTVPTLIAALFYDLSKEPDPKIPKQNEKRDRDLKELFRRAKKTVVLFINEAQELNGNTLIGLKRLIEHAQSAETRLAIVLVGHPKLRNDLRRPTMEQVGFRTSMVSLEGVAGSQRQFIRWTLETCSKEGVSPDDLITDEAADWLADRVKTPLQVSHYLTRAFDEGFKVGEKPVTIELLASIVATGQDDVEARLARWGYTARSVADQFNTQTAEIKRLFRGELSPARQAELTQQMMAAGLPV